MLYGFMQARWPDASARLSESCMLFTPLCVLDWSDMSRRHAHVLVQCRSKAHTCRASRRRQLSCAACCSCACARSSSRTQHCRKRSLHRHCASRHWCCTAGVAPQGGWHATARQHARARAAELEPIDRIRIDSDDSSDIFKFEPHRFWVQVASIRLARAGATRVVPTLASMWAALSRLLGRYCLTSIDSRLTVMTDPNSCWHTQPTVCSRDFDSLPQ